MKIIFLGNCQIQPLKSILKACVPEIYIQESVPIHLIKSEESFSALQQSIADSDYIVSQPLISTQYEQRHLSPTRLRASNDNVLIIPNLYFSGYHPTIQRPIHTAALGNRFRMGDYFDYLPSAISAIGKDPCFLLQDFRITSELVHKLFHNNATLSLNVLKDREKECDLIVSDYIEENWSKQYLFYTPNHPTNVMLEILARRINEILDLTTSAISSRIKPYLSNYRPPCYIAPYLLIESYPNYGGGHSDHAMQHSYTVENYIQEMNFELPSDINHISHYGSSILKAIKISLQVAEYL